MLCQSLAALAATGCTFAQLEALAPDAPALALAPDPAGPSSTPTRGGGPHTNRPVALTKKALLTALRRAAAKRRFNCWELVQVPTPPITLFLLPL